MKISRVVWPVFIKSLKLHLIFMESIGYIRPTRIKLHSLQPISVEVPNTKFNRNPFKSFRDETSDWTNTTSPLCVNFMKILRNLVIMTDWKAKKM